MSNTFTFEATAYWVSKPVLKLALAALCMERYDQLRVLMRLETMIAQADQQKRQGLEMALDMGRGTVKGLDVAICEIEKTLGFGAGDNRG